MDTAHEMFAQLFRHYRGATGSVSEAARIAGYDHSYVSQIEAGKRVPPLKSARDFDQAFDARGAIYDAARLLREAERKDRTAASLDTDDSADSLDERELGDVERRELLQRALGVVGTAGLASGSLGSLDAVQATLDDALDRSVEEWQEIAWDYGRDMVMLPPAEILDELAYDVLAVRRLLDRPASVSDRAGLQRVAAQLSAVMAATLGDLGELARARRWWRTARTAADRCGDAELAAWVRSRQAVRTLYEGSPHEVIVIADQALSRAPQQVGAGMMGALTARAQAYAVLGDREAHTDVDKAADAFEQLPDAVTADRTTFFGWAEQRLRHTESYVYGYFGDSRAPAAQEAALALYPQGHYGAPAQIELYRAGWLARTGDPSEGLRYAARVVSALPPAYRAYGIMSAARDVERALPAGAENTAEAVEYRELLALPSITG